MTQSRKPRVYSPDVLAKRAARDARIVELLRAGSSQHAVSRAAGVSPSQVRRVADAAGVPRPPRRILLLGRPPGLSGVLAMTHAQLDALERRVSADRAAGRLPPVSTT